jgi:hypothetical protein
MPTDVYFWHMLNSVILQSVDRNIILHGQPQAQAGVVVASNELHNLVDLTNAGIAENLLLSMKLFAAIQLPAFDQVKQVVAC